MGKDLRRKDWKLILFSFLILFSHLITAFCFFAPNILAINKNLGISEGLDNSGVILVFSSNTSNPEGILLNEICTDTDYIELVNYGPVQDMTGWQVRLFHSNAYYRTYVFPTGWLFPSGSIIVLYICSGTNNGNELYTGWNVDWSTNVAVGLMNGTGPSADWFQSSSYIGPKPPSVQWEQDVPIVFTSAYASRTSSQDTNKASDWEVLVSGTPGSPNPGPNITLPRQPPTLNLGFVNPRSGDQTTLFNFSVMYFDQNNDPPASINVKISGMTYSMLKQDPLDTYYLDGCLYQYITYLIPGNYTFWFECTDGRFSNSTGIFELNVIETPNNHPPWLLNPQVSPQIGTNTTMFNFTAWYYDLDNNQPSSINITINSTTYNMFPVNPLDENAMDGILYYFTTQLDYGYYRFFISCSDGLFGNSTGWINAPEVNPFYGLTLGPNSIVINEVCVNPDFVEMYNYGSDQDMTGWTIRIYDNDYRTYMFPAGWVFRSNNVVLLRENSGTNRDTVLYTGWNINWVSIAVVGLFDDTGAHVDWFQASGFTGSRPGDVEWTQDVSLTYSGQYYAYRTTDEDTNRASDWIVATSGSPGSLNPGQTGQGSSASPITLLSPSTGSSLFSGMIDFSWSPLEAPVGPLNYTLQISNNSDFSTILYQFDDIRETLPITFTTRLIDQPTARYYWRVRPTYNQHNGNWSNHAFFNLIQNNHPPNLISALVFPSIGIQSTQFNFSVIYFDIDDSPPIYVNVILNGTPYSMLKQDPLDTNYTDGCLYQYINYLIPGNYIFWFECTDGKFSNSTVSFTNLSVIETNSNSPSLTNGQVTPSQGTNSTIFTFLVNYMDLDNNAPIYVNLTINSVIYPMVQHDPLDTNYMDGCLFVYSTILNMQGIYYYYFNCSDGGFTSGDGPYLGPTVGFPELQNYVMEIGHAFNWVDATTGVRCNMAGRDDGTQLFYLPFTFNFYGTSFDHIYVCTNGFASFVGRTTYSNRPFPSAGYNYMIAPYWDDLRAGIPCNMYVKNLTGPNRVAIEWLNFDTLGRSRVGTFEIVLYESGDIVFNYAYLVRAMSYTCGLNYGVNPQFYNSYSGLTTSTNNFSIRFAAPTSINTLNLHSPADASSIFTGWTNFTWTSLEYPLGPVNYTLQISTQADFSNISLEIRDIPETSSYTSVPILLNFPRNHYYWRVSPQIGPFTESWSDHFEFDLIPNYFLPNLTSESIFPNTGDQFTVFNFSVIYRDLDNNPPDLINLMINGTSYSLQKQNPLDLDYTDGCLYYIATQLNPGNYTFWFECTDGKFSNLTSIFGLNVIETNNHAPWLVNPQVSPQIGTNTTMFDFTAWYYDLDNNYPSSINITINSTTYIMLPVNPLDFNAMDGLQYSFNTTFDYGYYRFFISCSDGLFGNSTGWINAPEVNPFYGLTFGPNSIVINEVCANPDFVEMYNYGPNQVMTGWSIQIYHGSSLYRTYTFPAGWVFRSNHIVVLRENSGTNTDTVLYTGWNIPWDSIAIAVGLFDSSGAHVDWIQTSTYTGSKPGDVEWGQDISFAIIYSNYAYRTNDEDTNQASDWVVTASGSQGSLNPGQTGQRSSSSPITLLTPSTGNTLFSGMNDFSWSTFEAPFGPLNYTFQLSSTSDFSTILYQFDDIRETPHTTSITMFLDQPTARYYWRVRPTYNQLNGDWTNHTFFELIQNIYPPNLVSAPVFPSLGNQFTQFTFSVTYFDIEDIPPIYVNVILNGTPHSMLKQDPLDTNYIDGCLYEYSTYLQPGIYQYTFHSSDGNFSSLPPLVQKLVVYDDNILPITNVTIFQPIQPHDTTPQVICRIHIAGAGINLSSVQYAFSTSGSLTPTNWAPVDGIYLDAAYSIPAHEGAKGFLYIKVNAVPFNQSSLTENTIRFRVSDLLNNEITSDVVVIEISEDPQSSSTFPLIFLLMVIGAIATGSYGSSVFIDRRRREQRVQALLKKVLNDPRIPPHLSPSLTEAYSFVSYHSTEPVEPSSDELAPTDGVAEGLFEINLPPITVLTIFKVMWCFKHSFPSLNEQIPTVEMPNILMELKTLPEKDLFTFFSKLLEGIPLNEVHAQTCVLLNELKDSQDHADWRPILHKIEELTHIAESLNDRFLLNNIFQLIVFFIKFAPEAPIEVPVEVPAENPDEPRIEVPVQVPVEVPDESRIEAPAQVPVEVAVEPRVELPVQEPAEIPAEQPINVLITKYAANYIGNLPFSELFSELAILLHDLKELEENQNKVFIFNEIEKLIDLAVSLNDRQLLNDLYQLSILIECSPADPVQVPVELPRVPRVEIPPQVPISVDPSVEVPIQVPVKFLAELPVETISELSASVFNERLPTPFRKSGATFNAQIELRGVNEDANGDGVSMQPVENSEDEEPEAPIEVREQIDSNEPYFFTFMRLSRAFHLVINSFPSLTELFPEEDRLSDLMDLKDFPDARLHDVFATLLTKVPLSEVLARLRVSLNKYKKSEEPNHQILSINKVETLIDIALSLNDPQLLEEQNYHDLLFNKIENLIDMAIAFNDRHLLNDLFQLFLLMECS